MTARPHNPARPSFYLDQSLLCDAFLGVPVVGVAKKSLPEYAPLFAWIERVAREANLCLAITHVVELAGWKPVRTADAVAAWLEGLPTVWVRSMAEVMDQEDEYWVKISVGAKPRDTVSPFASSILHAFHEITPKVAEEFLRKPTLPSLLVSTRKFDAAKIRQGGFEAADLFRADRRWAKKAGLSEEQKREITAAGARHDLRMRAQAAHDRLVASRNDEYAPHAGIGRSAQDALVELVASEPKAMPSWRVQNQFIKEFAAASFLRTAGGKTERESLPGVIGDAFHAAVGAAYCNVFTCDATTGSWLGPVRQMLGHPPPLAPGRYPSGLAGFVGDLMMTFP